MHSRLSRHRTRHIASVMLFVWLFALGAGWANACILQPADAKAGTDEQHDRSGHGAPQGSGHAVAAGASATHELDPAQQACASFCDTEQRIVTKTQPAKGDGAAEPSALATRVFAGWPAFHFTPARAESRWRPLAAPPPPGPPAAIAFLRLTI